MAHAGASRRRSPGQGLWILGGHAVAYLISQLCHDGCARRGARFGWGEVQRGEAQRSAGDTHMAKGAALWRQGRSAACAAMHNTCTKQPLGATPGCRGIGGGAADGAHSPSSARGNGKAQAGGRMQPGSHDVQVSSRHTLFCTAQGGCRGWPATTRRIHMQTGWMRTGAARVPTRDKHTVCRTHACSQRSRAAPREPGWRYKREVPHNWRGVMDVMTCACPPARDRNTRLRGQTCFQWQANRAWAPALIYSAKWGRELEGKE